MLNLPQKQEEAYKVAQSLFAFGQYAETRPAFEWIMGELARLDIRNRHARGEEGSEIRGACQALESIVNLVEQSREMTDKIRDALLKRKGANP